MVNLALNNGQVVTTSLANLQAMALPSILPASNSTSTTTIYTRFPGKINILQCLFFSTHHKRISTTQPDEPANTDAHDGQHRAAAALAKSPADIEQFPSGKPAEFAQPHEPARPSSSDPIAIDHAGDTTDTVHAVPVEIAAHDQPPHTAAPLPGIQVAPAVAVQVYHFVPEFVQCK